MGVYHFMGLGRSPGAVTAAISYLADRYDRYYHSDAQFFASSGEFAQEGKRGDIQALVLFSTHEVIVGEEDGLCADYVDNRPGQTRGTLSRDDRMETLLKRVLPAELQKVAGGRNQVALYWCEIDRTNPYLTFERIARVTHAVKPSGRVGKEIWMNLTGGTNIVNLALQLSAALLGHPARLYYLLSEDPRCLRHTTPKNDLGAERDRFWVEIPVIYLRLDAAAAAILEVLEGESRPLPDQELLDRLKGHPSHWNEFQDLDLTAFRRNYLLPMSGHQLLRRAEEHTVTVGQAWAILKRYHRAVAELRHPDSDAEATLEELAANQQWFTNDVISLDY